MRRLSAFLMGTEAAYMTMETVASRILAPYVGSEYAVWVSIVGVMLLGSAIGNVVGGRRTDDADFSSRLICAASFLMSCLLLLVPVLVRTRAVALVSLTPFPWLSASLLAAFLFLMPSIAAGVMPPCAMALAEGVDSGSYGRVYASSTTGGLVGTFVGGFVLVPSLASSQVMCVLSAVVSASALLMSGDGRRGPLVCSLAASLALVIPYGSLPSSSSYLAGMYGSEAMREYDGQYSKLTVFDTTYDGEPVRMLKVGEGFESATFTEPGRRYDLVFDYTAAYDRMFDAVDGIHDVLMIGGGGYSYPKHLMSTHGDVAMTVVEIDPKVTEVARSQFYLQDLIDEYDLDGSGRLRLVNDDGREWLRDDAARYDAILNDSFSGTTPAATLCTREAAESVKAHLRDGGAYLSNVIGGASGDGSRFLRAEVATLRGVFAHVYVVPVDAEQFASGNQTNCMVICSDRELNVNGAVGLDTEGVRVLTDEWCPVDTMVVR